MPKPSDFTEEELRWLSSDQYSRAYVPDDVARKFIELGLVDRADGFIFKNTGRAGMLLEDARNLGRLPKR